MKILLTSLFFGALIFNSCAQTNCNIKRAYAFYTVSIPGMAMADEKGNTITPKPNIGRIIYIEWCGINNPEIAYTLYNNKSLTAMLTKVEGSSVIPGGDIGNNSHFKISAQKCNSLWKLDLQATGDEKMPPQDCKDIIIKNKTCSFKVFKEIQLAAIPRY